METCLIVLQHQNDNHKVSPLSYATVVLYVNLKIKLLRKYLIILFDQNPGLLIEIIIIKYYRI